MFQQRCRLLPASRRCLMQFSLLSAMFFAD